MKASQQVQSNTTEGNFATMEEITDDQSTCNYIRWDTLGVQKPLYMNVGGTRLMLPK